MTSLLTATATTAFAALAAEPESDYAKKMREVHRRNLPTYIRQLHQPRAQNSAFEYEELVQWIANSHDRRALPTMMEVISDTGMRQTGSALLIAADFLGSMRYRAAIPVLTQNLTLDRRFGSAGKDAGYSPVWNTAVHLGAAAALFRLGELQLALSTFRAVLSIGDSNPEAIPSNAFQAVRTPMDAYHDRPKARDTIYQYLRVATMAKNPELRAGAALSLVEVDKDLAFRVASEVLSLKQPKKEDDIHRWYNISYARVTGVHVMAAIGDDKARLLLKDLVQDEDKNVRVAAQCALRDLELRK